MKFNLREKKIIIILMSINLFALFVNYFRLSPKINIGEYNNQNEYFLFTDTKEEHLLNQTSWYTNDGISAMYEFQNPKYFWPFTKFYEEAYNSSMYTKSRFRGVFTDFDQSEFLVYSLLIFGIPFIGKILVKDKKK